MIRNGLLLVNVEYHDPETKKRLSAYCIKDRRYQVKDIKPMARRSFDGPGVEVYEATTYGLDGKIDYKEVLTRDGDLWMIEFYVGVAAV